jgi:hypothetical protein
MNSKELDAVIRSASPTTRERLRTTLTNYQSMLTSRIASIKELATKEEVLRAQCGFGPLSASSVRTPSQSSKVAAAAPKSRKHVSQTQGDMSKSGAHRTTKSAVVSTPRISSALFHFSGGTQLAQGHISNSHASPTTSPRRSMSPPPQPCSSPPPSPQQRHSHHVHGMDNATVTNVDATANVITADDARPTSFADAEQELRQLFHRQKAVQKQQAHRRTSMDVSPSLRPEGVYDTSALRSSLLLSASTSSTTVPTETRPFNSQAFVAMEQRKLIERNQQLRARVTKVLLRSLTHQSGPAPPFHHLSLLSSPAPECGLCLCSECLELNAEAVETTLPVVFDCVQAMVGRAISPQSNPRTTSASKADDDATVLLHKEVATLQREGILLRLRRVELLAARLHHQRLSWFSTSIAEMLGGCSSVVATPVSSAQAIQVSHVIPSAVEILDALESAKAARLSYASLVSRETLVARLRDQLKGSLRLLSSLSMLSELQWCAEESMREANTIVS